MTAAGSSPRFAFETTIIYWRGPQPYFYAPTPAEQLDELRRVARLATYGWGCVPVEARIAGVTFTTSLFPKDGGYLLPIKASVRRATNITAGDTISVEMTVQPRDGSTISFADPL